jgi:hypothetical protein
VPAVGSSYVSHLVADSVQTPYSSEVAEAVVKGADIDIACSSSS